MLKITRKSIGKIKLLDDEKLALIKLLEQVEKDGYELYLFGSRIDGWGVDIDLMIKPDPGFKQILKYQTLFNLYSDTKLDLIPYNKETIYFFENII